MDAMQQKLLEAAIRMGVTLPGQRIIEATVVPETPVAAQAPAPAAEAASAVPVVDPPEMIPAWEKELDDMLAKSGGRLDIRLQSGTLLQVVPEPAIVSGAVQISHETFKRLSRAASILNGKVVDAMTKEQSDARTKEMLDKGLGCWVSPHIFIEVEKQAEPMGGQRPDLSVITKPGSPPTPPAVAPNLWLVLSGGSIVEQVPMRVTGGKVLGTLIKTTNGPIYAKQVKDMDHKLNIHATWAMSGGYTIERELYDKYLTDPRTVVKFVRSDRIYFTTSEWIQKYGGLIRHWGTERVVMPLSGNFWVVVDKNGEIIS